MTHARNRFQFTICGVFRLAVCFAIVVAPLVFFYSNAKAVTKYEILRNKIDDVISRDAAAHWPKFSHYTRGSATIDKIEEVSNQELSVHGTFRYKTLLGMTPTRHFRCSVNFILDDMNIKNCCWYEELLGMTVCTAR